MTRKEFICLALSTMLLALGLPAQAQQPKKIAKIGYLVPSTTAAHAPNLEAFRQGLRELSYVEGKTFVLELRYGEGRFERLPELARELVGLKPDVIVTISDVASAAVKRETQTIPIVMVGLKVDVIVTTSDLAIATVKRETQTIPIVMTLSTDPVATGFVASLARPGGNVTGLSSISPELSGKRLELLREVIPGLSRVAFLWNPDVRGNLFEYNTTEGAARSLRLQLQSVEVLRAEDLDRAFSAITKERAQALVLPTGDPIAFANRGQIASFAQKNRLPSIYASNLFVDAGGLMSYGPRTPDMHRRAATFVDKILKGAKPADLPVEQPTKFELVINLKTATQIGVTIPPNMLARADQVIK